jgi:serine/threonine-protein kinase
MYEMLAGRPPFVGPTAVSIAMQHASANPPPLRQFSPQVPPVLEQLVSRMLEKDTEDRFGSAVELQASLRACAKELARGKQSTLATGQAYPGRYAEGQGQYPPTGHSQF